MTGSARQAAIQAQLAYKMKRLVTEADFDRSAHVGPVSELRLPAHDSLLLRHLEAALKSSFNGDVVSLNRVVHVDDVGDDDPWTESVKDHARWHGIEMDEQTETRAANNDIVVFSTILRCRSPQPSQPPKSPKSPSLGFHTPPPMSLPANVRHAPLSWSQLASRLEELLSEPRRQRPLARPRRQLRERAAALRRRRPLRADVQPRLVCGAAEHAVQQPARHRRQSGALLRAAHPGAPARHAI